MAEPIIQVEALSKLYALGKVGTGSFRQDIKRWWLSSVLKKNDPFFSETGAADDSHIWALHDVSFDVKEGEVFGIIGSNGAGKSTLLKILSGIINPTRGIVRGRGRINSLLEIGTGFNDELSGRENIYLNGYFLGMQRREIKKKFDEIVAFSGVEQFIDTPVKRYSSGMYMRLAFAVAAHLEPDILIVDEVLAVGDADFQKKCLGKMQEVSSRQGRTILYVSHNMQSVISLCHRAMHLQKGKMIDIGTSLKVVNAYMSRHQQKRYRQSWDDINHSPGNNFIRVNFVELIPHLKNADDPVDIRTPITIRFKFWNLIEGQNICVGLHLFTQSRECIFDVSSTPQEFRKGLAEGQVDIPGNFLNDGSYYFSLIFVKDTSVELFYLEDCLSLEVEDYRENMNWFGKWSGHVRPKFPFRVRQLAHAKEAVPGS
ncbi:ABC transporter ATP-binding protein [Fulvivirgaceae bacterium PWU4]|uniref:ABC transporter ATP-binding protein n=1 Tax=Chryseosolibacter histidini TaxID=2782349 RepID=A0AAP2GPS0_9BACT|nr:ABC transporter ATP-binding protein [Chryseosolibacter histidini]MBT1697747.1 ABC transporter ATP-binding protein [Chryseosolibacter histidini]